MKSNTILSLGFVLSVCLFPACELTDLNIDPARPAEVSLDLILPEALSSTAFNQSANTARVPALIMQYWGGFDVGCIAFSQYYIHDHTFENYWKDGLYGGALNSCKAIIDHTHQEESPYYLAIGKILMAENYGQATAFFGDIPFSEALLGNDNLIPAYDLQEEIYYGIQKLLDEAIVLLEGPSRGNFPDNDDLIFNGDPELWKKTAYALKARYLLHSLKRDETVLPTVLDYVRNKAFSSIDEQPDFQWGEGPNENNPIAKFGKERYGAIIISDYLVERTTQDGDPRRPLYMQQNEWSEWSYFDENSTELVWAQDDSAIPIISYPELKFIETEASHLSMYPQNEVENLLKQAITASMELLDIDPVDYQQYLDTRGDLNGLDFHQVHERIIEEAYMAYYGMAFQQAWANYRRTGYPDLTPSSSGGHFLNPGGGIPQRFLYPPSEKALNSENTQEAIDRQNGALLDVPVWAFQ